MRPIGSTGIGVEINCASPGRNIAGVRFVCDKAVHVHGAVAVGEVEAGGVVMVGDETAAPDVEPGLHAEQPAGNAGIGEGLVSVVDLLAEEASPAGAAPTLSVSAGIFDRQRIANALMQ